MEDRLVKTFYRACKSNPPTDKDYRVARRAERTATTGFARRNPPILLRVFGV